MDNEGLVTSRKQFGDLVYQKIIQRYTTIAQAAKDLGIDSQSILSYTYGKNFPRSKNTLEVLCNGLEISITSLNLPLLVAKKYHRSFGILINSDNGRQYREVGGYVEGKDLSVKEKENVSCYNGNGVYKIGGSGEHGLIIGSSPNMRKVFALLDNIINNPDQNSVVLITGETGTGKELVAKAIHYNSPRADYPFIGVNITALPEGLLESELFGHKRGAFTGAVSDVRGFFEEADSGTLFLDEIGYMTKPSQARLLRVLQEKEFYRVGETKPKDFLGRVVVATGEYLDSLVKNGDFRKDLYYRINVVNIELPPLRDRLEDIPLLFSYIVEQHNKECGTDYSQRLNSDNLEVLISNNFPGNVRELRNLIKRAIFKHPENKELVIEEVIPKSTY